MMGDTFTGLLRVLKESSSESRLFSSCEPELLELMRQIDIMVENKRFEWEHQLQSVHLQLERRDRDIINLRETVELRNQEVGKCQQRIDGEAENHRDMISQYEDQVQRLKGEIDHVKKNYSKLQRNSSKQTSEADRKNIQVVSELEKRDQELKRMKVKLEELEDKTGDQEVLRKGHEDRIHAMEGQRKALIEKSELMQDQLLGYQSQLTRKKQLLDALEQKYTTLAVKHDSEVAQHDSDVIQYKEELKSQEETIRGLKKSLNETVKGGEKNLVDYNKLRDDCQKLNSRNKVLEPENIKLQKEVRLKDDNIKIREDDLKRQARELLGLQKMLREKDQSIRQYEELDDREHSDITRSLQQEVETLETELQTKSRTEEVLRDQIEKQDTRISDLCDEYDKLKDRLLITETEGVTEDTKNFILQSEITKLENHLEDKNKEHSAVINGMKEEISLLTQELHRRDSALAGISERGGRIERELRDTNSNIDKKAAELLVANAQLEALRLENRHLRDTAIKEQLTTTDELRLFENHLSDIRSSNANAVAQLEEENRCLVDEVSMLRNETSIVDVENRPMLKDSSRISKATDKVDDRRRNNSGRDTTDDRVNALQAKLEITIQNYEEDIEILKQENDDLKENLNKKQYGDKRGVNGERRQLPERSYQFEVSSDGSPQLSSTFVNHTENSFGSKDDLDLDHLFDILETTNFESDRSSERQSITSDFITEEKKREKELEQLLEDRIAELNIKTEETLKKYMR